ncbi:hypothetical protein N1851_012379 [Merluccius polli]|uniref:Reverse transcriptase domain-containing protein n=1 Tax=Merluccius polli TaxID=89951 RepID=A0AA47P528_MERPO|nr:hypothetical protein N1851_012379 [Merluccius polli]
MELISSRAQLSPIQALQDILCFLWRLMKVVWRQQEILTLWRRAGGNLIPKEKDSSEIDQFSSFEGNVEGKIFFIVVAHRLSGYLPRNHMIETSKKQASQASPAVWNMLAPSGIRSRWPKRKGTDLHVVFLDLAKAFGSVPHKPRQGLIPGRAAIPVCTISLLTFIMAMEIIIRSSRTAAPCQTIHGRPQKTHDQGLYCTSVEKANIKLARMKIKQNKS